MRLNPAGTRPPGRLPALALPGLLLSGLLLAGGTVPARADALGELSGSFREAYQGAVAQGLAGLRASVPVLVNRFEQIALYRPGVEAPEIFAMELAQYRQASAVAHAAATLAVRLQPDGPGPLDATRRAFLTRFEAQLRAAEAELAEQPGLSEEVRQLQGDMLAETRRTTQRILQRGAVEPGLLEALGTRMRAGIGRNLEWAARTQLEQFRAQAERWKAAYPDLAWDRAVVVVIGVHQARNGNLQRQFFDWLLHDTPERQDRVVFAETPVPPPPLGEARPDDALGVLARVMIDKDLARIVLGDPQGLQSDVLAPAAAALIGTWGR
ncbi:MAG: hypothetical protein AAGC69_02600 [Paracraurococcus sp.]|jgi:hypothetical protein